MKKIVKILFIACIILLLSYTFVTATSINANLKIDKTIIKQNEEIIVTLELNEFINVGEGINAFVGTFKFDKEKFEVISIEGENNWNTPVYTEVTLHEGYTKIVTTRDDFLVNSGEILKVTLKAKKDIIDYTSISISDLLVAVKKDNKTTKLELNDTSIKLNEPIDSNIIETNNNYNTSKNNINIIVYIIVIGLLIILLVILLDFIKYKKNKKGDKNEK